MDRILIERNWQNITTYQFKTMGKTLSKAKENLMLIFPKGFEQIQSKCNNHGNNCTTFALTLATLFSDKTNAANYNKLSTEHETE